ncbi:MAG: type II secretion system F family protein [Coprococcus sp.]
MSDKKKQRKIEEPQYYMSRVQIPVMNYKVYHMSVAETIVTFLVAFVIGAAVAYLFYGGLFKDEYGNATMATWISNIVFMVVVGIIAGKMFIPIRTKSIIVKNQSQLKEQFRSMLESVNTSLGAGNNAIDSFESAYRDLKVQYDESAFILQELNVLLIANRNNIDIETMLLDFGERSGIDDIRSFANVYDICYRKGGNLRDVINNTHAILSDKMSIMEDIETMVASNKMEQNMMVVMPIALIGVIKMMSPDFGDNYTTAAGVIATTLGIICFVAAYYIGRKILDIKL